MTHRQDMAPHGMVHPGMGIPGMGCPLLAVVPPQELSLDTWLEEEEATTTPRPMNTATAHDPNPVPVCYDPRQ